MTILGFNTQTQTCIQTQTDRLTTAPPPPPPHSYFILPTHQNNNKNFTFWLTQFLQCCRQFEQAGTEDSTSVMRIAQLQTGAQTSTVSGEKQLAWPCSAVQGHVSATTANKRNVIKCHRITARSFTNGHWNAFTPKQSRKGPFTTDAVLSPHVYAIVDVICIKVHARATSDRGINLSCFVSHRGEGKWGCELHSFACSHS